jgi:ADP-ribose pyrophosphatase YjhB (NUDIX family)
MHSHDSAPDKSPDTAGAVGDWPGAFRFCPMCGHSLTTRLVADKPRPSCESCGFVHFRNPGVGAAVVLRDERGRLLLVRRGPGATRAGLWSIPAGYVDYGEDVRAGAARELLEETGLEAEIGAPVWVATNTHDPAKVTVGIWFEGRQIDGVLEAGDDADDVGWFHLDDLPPLAFDTDRAYIASLDS